MQCWLPGSCSSAATLAMAACGAGAATGAGGGMAQSVRKRRKCIGSTIGTLEYKAGHLLKANCKWQLVFRFPGRGEKSWAKRRGRNVMGEKSWAKRRGRKVMGEKSWAKRHGRKVEKWKSHEKPPEK